MMYFWLRRRTASQAHYLDNVVNGLAAMMPSDNKPTDATPKESDASILNAFEAPNAVQVATEQVQALAEEIVMGDAELDNLKAQVAAKEEQLYRARKALYDLLASAGKTEFKCPNGLWPHTRLNKKVFKAKGVSDEQLFEWLHNNGLDSIIKPTVHWGTLSSTMKEYEDAGNEIPSEIFNVVEEPVVTMIGKGKFLAFFRGSPDLQP
ncbi:MAG TPA: hypothetical protein PLU87_18990 [Sedimentisphaerales bacterium]|nr:hypothetical protein [Sedimentisphaerales bacterium]HRS13211.1 hypothetical protein [Sedimentisphaerales bacterium]